MIDGDGFCFLETTKTLIQREGKSKRRGSYTKEATSKGKGGASLTCGAFGATKNTGSWETC